MIKEVKNIEDANKCDELLTKLVLDEKQYDDLIDENTKIENYFKKIMNDENIKLLAYYVDKKIVGYVLIKKLDNNICLLDGLYVLEEYRKKGIAKKLLNEALIKCRKYKVKYVDINVMYENEIAKSMYKKMNFKEFEIKLRKEI